GQVDLPFDKAAAGRFDQLPGFGGLTRFRDAGDVGPGLGQAVCHALPEAAAPAGDQGDAAVEFEQIENHGGLYQRVDDAAGRSAGSRCCQIVSAIRRCPDSDKWMLSSVPSAAASTPAKVRRWIRWT